MGIEEARSAFYYTRGKRAKLMAEFDQRYSSDSGITPSVEEFYDDAKALQDKDLNPWIQGVKAFVGLRTAYPDLDPGLL